MEKQTSVVKTDTKKNSDRYKRIGVLWKKQTTDNRGYLSGRLTMSDEFGISKDYAISIWPSRNKTSGDNNPDYVIDMDTERTKSSPLPKKVTTESKPAVFSESNSAASSEDGNEKSTKTGESLL